MIIKLNPASYDQLTQPARYYYSLGSRYSAKTFDIIQVILLRLLLVPGSRACLMRKVLNSIKETLYQDVKFICDYNGIDYIPFKSPLEIELPNGSTIIFKGADDPEKLKGLSSVDIVMMDEANEFSEMDFETIDQSIRGKRQDNSIYLAHNPVPLLPGSSHWFQRRFKIDKSPGIIKHYFDESLGSYVSTMRSTYKQNLKCPDHVKRRLEGYKETNPSLYKLWALGEYAEMEGVILKGWDVVDKVPPYMDLLGYGLDFGFSNDPAACVAVYGNRNEIWVKGLVYSTGLTNGELFKKLESAGVGPHDRIWADSAEPKSIEELHRLGLRGIKGVKKRANYKTEMANILRGMTIHLVDGDTDLQREFSTWSWDTDKNGKALPRPKDGNDHYIDSLIMCLWMNKRRRRVTITERIA